MSSDAVEEDDLHNCNTRRDTPDVDEAKRLDWVFFEHPLIWAVPGSHVITRFGEMTMRQIWGLETAVSSRDKTAPINQRVHKWEDVGHSVEHAE